MTDEWHGIPSIRRQGRQETGKVGIVSSRYELCLSFNWCSITSDSAKTSKACSVCSPKPFKALPLVFQDFCSLVRHTCTLFCHVLFSACHFPTLRHDNPEKRKQWPLTRSFLHEKLSKPLLDWRTFFHLQTRKSILYNFKSIALQLLWLYMFSMSVQGSDQKQSCHGQAPPESELRAVWQIFHVMQ